MQTRILYHDGLIGTEELQTGMHRPSKRQHSICNTKLEVFPCVQCIAKTYKQHIYTLDWNKTVDLLRSQDARAVLSSGQLQES
jgi:hypothetical protein